MGLEELHNVQHEINGRLFPMEATYCAGNRPFKNVIFVHHPLVSLPMIQTDFQKVPSVRGITVQATLCFLTSVQELCPVASA